MNPLKPDIDMIKLGLACKCPRCREGSLFKSGLTLELQDKCDQCGLDLSKNDDMSQDGRLQQLYMFGSRDFSVYK